MAVITQEGFDMRLAGMQGSLGAGTYFAGIVILQYSEQLCHEN